MSYCRVTCNVNTIIPHCTWKQHLVHDHRDDYDSAMSCYIANPSSLWARLLFRCVTALARYANFTMKKMRGCKTSSLLFWTLSAPLVRIHKLQCTAWPTVMLHAWRHLVEQQTILGTFFPCFSTPACWSYMRTTNETCNCFRNCPIHSQLTYNK